MKKPAIYGYCPHCNRRYRLNQFGPKYYLRKHYLVIPQTDAQLGIMGNVPGRKVRCPGSGKLAQ